MYTVRYQEKRKDLLWYFYLQFIVKLYISNLIRTARLYTNIPQARILH
jgi:hypothetical protein